MNLWGAEGRADCNLIRRPVWREFARSFVLSGPGALTYFVSLQATFQTRRGSLIGSNARSKAASMRGKATSTVRYVDTSDSSAGGLASLPAPPAATYVRSGRDTW